MSSHPTPSPRTSRSARPDGAAPHRPLGHVAALVGLAVTALSCGGGAPEDPLPTVASTPSAPAITNHASEPDPSAAQLRWPGRDSFSFTEFVPDNAVAYFEVRSIRELEEAALRVQTLAGMTAEEADITIATSPISMIGIDPSRIDRNARIAIAYAPIPGSPFPSPIVIAPAMDDGPVEQSAATLAARDMLSKRVDAGYVVVEHVAMHADVPRGGSPLVHDLPKGLVQGRFASDAFAPLLSPPLNKLADHLNEAYRLSRPRVSAQDLYEFDANEAIRVLTSMEVVAVGLSLDGDRADVRLRVARDDGITPTATACSRVDETIHDLAHHIDVEDPISMLVALNPDVTVEDIQQQWIQAMTEQGVDVPVGMLSLELLDPETRELLQETVAEISTSFEPGAAVSLFMEPAKAHVAFYLSARDKLRARQSISSLLARCELDTWGFEMALPLRSMVDQTLVEDYSVRFDSRRLDFDQRAKMRKVFKTFLGDSTLHLKVATSEHHVLVILGGDTTAVNGRIRAFASEGATDPFVSEAVDALRGADNAMVMHADFVKFLGQVAGVAAVASGRSVAETAREIAREVGDAQAPFTFWSGTVGAEEIFGMSFDLEALTNTIDAFKGSGL